MVLKFGIQSPLSVVLRDALCSEMRCAPRCVVLRDALCSEIYRAAMLRMYGAECRECKES